MFVKMRKIKILFKKMISPSYNKCLKILYNMIFIWGRLPEIKVLFSLPYKEYIRMLRNICEDWEILQKKTLQQQANKHYSRWFLLFKIKITLQEDVKNLIECCMLFSNLAHKINLHLYSNWSVKSSKMYSMWGWGTQE